MRRHGGGRGLNAETGACFEADRRWWIMYPLVWVRGLPCDVFGDGGAVIECDRMPDATPLSTMDYVKKCTVRAFITATVIFPPPPLLWPGVRSKPEACPRPGTTPSGNDPLAHPLLVPTAWDACPCTSQTVLYIPQPLATTGFGMGDGGAPPAATRVLVDGVCTQHPRRRGRNESLR